MGRVVLVCLLVSVGLGAFLGAFFLCGFGLSRYFYSLGMPYRFLKGSGRADVFGAIWRKINNKCLGSCRVVIKGYLTWLGVSDVDPKRTV